MRGRIAVIGANEPLLPFYRQAKNLGYEIVGIATEEGAVCKEFCDVFYPISFKDMESVLRVCKEEKIDGILSFSLESALPTVVYVAHHLGLVSNSEECVRLTQSKFAQRQALEKTGLPVPKYYLIRKITDIDSINCLFPVIVKPADSGGSQGVMKVDSRENLIEAFNYSIKFSRTQSVIVEEYIDGREFSVEYISFKGKHFFIQITDKVTSGAPRFVELQHHQPADISLDLKDRIKYIVEQNLDALKIENSVSHTEIKLNSNDELFIIETGARMGGDFITSDLVKLSTGYDLVDGAIKLAINKFEVPLFKFNKFSGVFFYSALAPNVGLVIQEHKNWPEIVGYEYSREPLKEVNSNADRCGYFLYQSIDGRMRL